MPVRCETLRDQAEDQSILFQLLRSVLGGIDSHNYPAGVELFSQDGNPSEVYLLEGGLVKLTRSEENGRELILDIRFAYSLLGSAAAIQQKPHSFSAITATACTVTSFSAKRFLDLLKEDPRLRLFVYQVLSDEILNQAARMSEIACLPARKRLEQLLWQIREKDPLHATAKAHRRFQLPLKHWEAARLLAITPTYLSRLLAELESEAIITRKNGWIVVQKPGLLWHRID
jgi:CRP/FNR family transcriptional regulator